MSEVISLREKVAQAELDARIYATERRMSRDSLLLKRGRLAKPQ
jgi:hypothetical protein